MRTAILAKRQRARDTGEAGRGREGVNACTAVRGVWPAGDGGARSDGGGGDPVKINSFSSTLSLYYIGDVCARVLPPGGKSLTVKKKLKKNSSARTCRAI